MSKSVTSYISIVSNGTGHQRTVQVLEVDQDVLEEKFVKKDNKEGLIWPKRLPHLDGILLWRVSFFYHMPVKDIRARTNFSRTFSAMTLWIQQLLNICALCSVSIRVSLSPPVPPDNIPELSSSVIRFVLDSWRNVLDCVGLQVWQRREQKRHQPPEGGRIGERVWDWWAQWLIDFFTWLCVTATLCFSCAWTIVIRHDSTWWGFGRLGKEDAKLIQLDHEGYSRSSGCVISHPERFRLSLAILNTLESNFLSNRARQVNPGHTAALPPTSWGQTTLIHALPR